MITRSYLACGYLGFFFNRLRRGTLPFPAEAIERGGERRRQPLSAEESSEDCPGEGPPEGGETPEGREAEPGQRGAEGGRRNAERRPGAKRSRKTSRRARAAAQTIKKILDNPGTDNFS